MFLAQYDGLVVPLGVVGTAHSNGAAELSLLMHHLFVVLVFLPPLDHHVRVGVWLAALGRIREARCTEDPHLEEVNVIIILVDVAHSFYQSLK